MIKLLFFGEILWDIFDNTDDAYKIGGAEFNKAAHAARIGAESFLVTAVGDDELGRAALDKLRACGINTLYVSKNHLSTGYCSVTLKDGKPQYELAKNTAYDMIPTDIINDSFDALCFGTLALRSEYNRNSLFELISRGVYGDIYFDINIREGFCPPELLKACLSHTTILKASRDEIHFLGYNLSDYEQICISLSEQYKNLNIILITKDSDGAIAYDCCLGIFYHSQKPTGKLVSAVGAGDSFGACFLYNYKNGIPIKTSLERAVILSDFVVTKLEAVPDYPAGLLEKIR